MVGGEQTSERKSSVMSFAYDGVVDPAPARLAALAAIVDHGTFEAAARRLHVTPSAVSQRIRALEQAAGQVLLRRTTPCRPTAAGEALVRLARQTALLHDEAAAVLAGGGAAPVSLSVAVSADALATWFRGALAALARSGTDRPAVALRLHVEDQGWSADLLRRGDVLGAVTSDPVAVQGCTSEPLGVLRYRAVAAHGLVPDGPAPDAPAGLPMLVLNEKDDLQHGVLRARGLAEPTVVHRVPTSADFAEAVRLGLGWGLLPEPQLAPLLRDGAVVDLGIDPVDVALHWQRWRLDTPALERLTDAVRDAARAGLHPPTGHPGPTGATGR